MKRRKNENYPDYVNRKFSHLSEKDREQIVETVKESWFDGLEFERKHK